MNFVDRVESTGLQKLIPSHCFVLYFSDYMLYCTVFLRLHAILYSL